MAKARRAAKPNSARVLVPVIAGLALLAGAGVAAWQLWPEASTTSAQPQSSVITTPAQGSTPMAATPSETPSQTPTPSPTQSATPNPDVVKAQQALESCRAKVAAADEVIKEAKTGVGHWAKHVDAQRQADLGNYTPEQMKAQFKATRVLGPEDQKRYHAAVDNYRSQDGDCGTVAKAPAEIAASLDKCHRRSVEQRPVMDAGDKGMADWASHLADMQRNKVQHLSNAQSIWVRAYRAAPTNINGFKEAIDNYDPPSC